MLWGLINCDFLYTTTLPIEICDIYGVLMHNYQVWKVEVGAGSWVVANLIITLPFFLFRPSTWCWSLWIGSLKTAEWDLGSNWGND